MDTFEFAIKQKIVKDKMEKLGITPEELEKKFADRFNNSGNNGFINAFGNPFNINNTNGTISPYKDPRFINPAFEILNKNEKRGLMGGPQSGMEINNSNQNVMDQNGNVDTNKIRENLSQFKSFAKATISDDGTININYGPADISEIVKSYGNSDPEINQYEKDYEEAREAFSEQIFAEKVISPVYHPPDKYKNIRNKSGGE